MHEIAGVALSDIPLDLSLNYGIVRRFFIEQDLLSRFTDRTLMTFDQPAMKTNDAPRSGDATRIWGRLLVFLVLALLVVPEARGQVTLNDVLQLRAWGVPSDYESGPVAEGDRQVIEAFRAQYPLINPVSTTGIQLPGSDQQQDMVPLMQIAGGIAPDVVYVNFRQSQTYIDMGLLCPLDQYVNQMAGVELPDGGYHLNNADYLAALKRGAGWPQIAQRVPEPCWEVMRRRDPKGDGYHVYAFPLIPLVMGLQYDKTIFAQYLDQGVQLRVPRDWEDMLHQAALMTEPSKGQYGLLVDQEEPGWPFLSFLYSAGGYVVQKVTVNDLPKYRKTMANVQVDDWVCTLDSEAAVEAAYFWARLRDEKVIHDGKFICRGVVRIGDTSGAQTIRYAMRFSYLDQLFMAQAADQTQGFGPVPAGPTGLQRSELNARMVGIFSGLAKQPKLLQASWDYIRFYDGPEARRIRVRKLVEAGLGPFVRHELLEQSDANGQYDSIIRQISPDLDRTYKIAFAGGVPEPYGKNCQSIYDEMRGPLQAIWDDSAIRDAIDAGKPEAAKAIIRGILHRATTRINVKMLGNLSPQESRQRQTVAWVIIILILAVFILLLGSAFKAFNTDATSSSRGWQFARYWPAYAMMAPAVLSIGLWMYWPMIMGAVMAFQNYNVLGGSTWVGTGNFATVLYSGEFWHSLWVTVLYGLLFVGLGFCTPIILAVLLTAIPRGQVLFRTLYYLPAVLSGITVILMWKDFYSPEGMVNQVLNGAVWILNFLPGVHLSPFSQSWLTNSTTALLACLLPVAWAGIGPGCLIYLAALKTVPEEIYEAADIDGATIGHKIFGIALPMIKTLIMINFIGVMIGAIRSSGGFILAMTGGGPYGESGGATEVIGLKLFYTTFGYLQFGVGAAMAWVIGAMLIGFSVMQMRWLSRVQFNAAGG